MALELQTEHENLLVVKVSGKLTKADYAAFLPKVNTLIKEHSKISILFDMHDFHGWEAAAAWEDTKFTFRHFHDIERLAIVGETRWQKAMAVVCKPFTRAEVRYFTREQGDEAHQWASAQPATH
jgi:hypothetical protein